ncbi:MAG: hypothetical protein Q4F00_12620 [bacterium]|nr:hypothetical protein [bacterium]
MSEIYKTGHQICPHCYEKTDVLIDVHDEEGILGKYTCSRCGRKFTLLEAAEAKVHKNTGYYPGQDRTSPFYLEGVNPRSKEAMIYRILVCLLLIFGPILFNIFLEIDKPLSNDSPTSKLCERVIMGNSIHTSSFEAFVRFGLFLAIIGSILFFIGKICKKLLFKKLKIDRQIDIKKPQQLDIKGLKDIKFK